jgi:hypothetical protein
MIINPSFPCGFVTFCDDIRQEIGGKTTLVGVYGPQMNVFGIAPVSIPKICALVDFRFLAEMLPANVEVKIFRSDHSDPLATIKFELPENESYEFESSSDLEPNSISFNQAIFSFQLTDFLVIDTCSLRIRAYIGEDEVRLGTMKVALIPQNGEVTVN